MCQKNTLKVFGTIDLYTGRFLYHFEQRLNCLTYQKYLEGIINKYYPKKIFLIQDNAAYHKDRDLWSWFSDERKYITVYNLPAYSPELNAAEKVWHHVRLNSTHNHYFDTQDELYSTLISCFKSIQHNPGQIMGYLQSFQ